MPNSQVDLLAIDKGLITAPAGCGKTHLIAEAIRRHKETKPVLILTHTNAGVIALRNRLIRFGANASSYRLLTLDGLAIRLVSNFPKKSGINPNILKLDTNRIDYKSIREAACKLLSAGIIQDILSSTYSRLIVDEYQDCCTNQHAVVTKVASALPTCILGDQLQAVFKWVGLPEWGDVLETFPVVEELTTPWRWRNAGTERFGLWLLEIRKKLLQGEVIDFTDSPEEVSWVQLNNAQTCYQCQLQAARVQSPTPNGTVLIIGNGKNPNEQRKFASQTPGAVTIENVDLTDLMTFARSFNFESNDAVVRLIDFASQVLRNVNAAYMVKRIESLEKCTARRPATETEAAALRFKSDPTPSNAIELLVEINKAQDVTSHRPAILRTCIKSLKSCVISEATSFYEAIVRAREQNRFSGRSLPRRAVGSTLLLKGLEADVSVILDASDHDVQSLYVAMTRGSRQLIVCSSHQRWLRPTKR